MQKGGGLAERTDLGQRERLSGCMHAVRRWDQTSGARIWKWRATLVCRALLAVLHESLERGRVWDRQVALFSPFHDDARLRK